MNKTMLISIAATAAAGVLATFLLKRKKQRETRHDPALQKSGNPGKHITDVFSRAKEHGL
jgi:hypothetical protein